MVKAKRAVEDLVLEVGEITFSTARCYLYGATPLIMNRFSQKAWQELLLPSARKNRASLEQTLKHDPLAEFRGSVYKTTETSAAAFHFPTGAFHKAIAQAAIDLPGAKRAQIERLTKVIDVNVELFGLPQIYMAMVRNSDINRTPDVRTRAIFPEWACQINVSFVRSIIAPNSVANLIMAAGAIVGIGDWRSEKGGSFGAFKVVPEDNRQFKHVVERQARVEQMKSYIDPVPYDHDTTDIFTWFTAEIKKREKGYLSKADLELPSVPIHVERGNASDPQYTGIEQ